MNGRNYLLGVLAVGALSLGCEHEENHDANRAPTGGMVGERTGGGTRSEAPADPAAERPHSDPTGGMVGERTGGGTRSGTPVSATTRPHADPTGGMVGERTGGGTRSPTPPDVPSDSGTTRPDAR